MHFSAVLVAVVAAAIGSASASASPRALASVNQASSFLVTRQAACVSTCTPAQNQVTSCGVNPDCLCSSTLAAEVSSCAQCRDKADPSLHDQLETAWNQYSQGCASLGHPVSGGLDGASTGATTTPSVIANPTTTTPSVIANPTTTTTTPAFSFSPVATSAAAAASSAAPAATTSSSSDGGLVSKPNSASTLTVGGAFGLSVAAVVAALL
ncbi:hypothetical protein FRB90_003449 [Tulasnella sp. 427]|nr:hypothetical protein FRB90_003449 [Tulasnella sp. 427]